MERISVAISRRPMSRMRSAVFSSVLSSGDALLLKIAA
jgi:hypothetical protein